MKKYMVTIEQVKIVLATIEYIVEAESTDIAILLDLKEHGSVFSRTVTEEKRNMPNKCAPYEEV